MTLRRLQVNAFAGLVVFVLLLEAVRYAVFPQLPSAWGRLLIDCVVVLGALVFFGFVFRTVRRLQEELVRQGRELLTLHAAAEDVHRAVELDDLLQRVVDEARDLLGARYGAISVIDDDGAITSFHVSGLSEEEELRIGPPPRGHGLLGVALYRGQVVRLPDISRDPRKVGFPPHHPPMRSLLAVPVDCRGPFHGNLYLADKIGEREFPQSDAETLQRFATQVAIAIDNHFVSRRLRELAVAEERARIARDLHDGTAQILAYVKTKAQVVREYFDAGKTDLARAHLDELSTAASDVLTDVREDILGLRIAGESGRSLAESLRGVLAAWRDQTGVSADLSVDDALRLAPERELQLLRIIQEALANVRKHAGARHLQLTMRREGDQLALEVLDDGVGFDPAAPPPAELERFGLSTMRERAEVLSGWLRVESQPGGPTRVVAQIPIKTPIKGPVQAPEPA